MKNIILLLLLGVFSFTSFSQEQECGTTTSKRDFNSDARKISRSLKSSPAPLTYKEIPIVFHVLYDEKLQNVSDSILYLAVKDLNVKFNKAKFRFVLLSIKRKPLKDFSWYDSYMNEPTTSSSARNIEIAQTMGVDPNKTLNIYVQPKLHNVLGFSYIPPFGKTTISPYPKHPDGVWIRTSTFSLIPSSYNVNATLIHEIGHYLGLYHTFNGSFSCQNFGLDCATTGDLVCDTPPFQKSNPLPDCTPGCNVIILDSDPWRNYVQDNHMDYLSSNCRRSFTNGQISRMHSYVVSERNNLYKTLSYECLFDLDKDGVVGSSDVLIYLPCHGLPSSSNDCYKCDIDGDGFVGSQDFLVFLTLVGQSCLE